MLNDSQRRMFEFFAAQQAASEERWTTMITKIIENKTTATNTSAANTHKSGIEQIKARTAAPAS